MHVTSEYLEIMCMKIIASEDCSAGLTSQDLSSKVLCIEQFGASESLLKTISDFEALMVSIVLRIYAPCPQAP